MSQAKVVILVEWITDPYPSEGITHPALGSLFVELCCLLLIKTGEFCCAVYWHKTAHRYVNYVNCCDLARWRSRHTSFLVASSGHLLRCKVEVGGGVWKTVVFMSFVQWCGVQETGIGIDFTGPDQMGGDQPVCESVRLRWGALGLGKGSEISQKGTRPCGKGLLQG